MSKVIKHYKYKCRKCGTIVSMTDYEDTIQEEVELGIIMNKAKLCLECLEARDGKSYHDYLLSGNE